MELPSNFLHEIIDEDIKNGLTERIHTRFPPEPNGYLHIGSAKAIYINWSVAQKYNGLFNLRFDDTNPVREDDEYVQSILQDVAWLTGSEPSGGIFYGSDYFEKCYECAIHLIKAGKAYVCDLTQDEMREGKYEKGTKTLRAKIDMASPNMNMRDPAIYRIVYATHHRIGNKWCIYPLYDFAHPIQDAMEHITHSMCSIEFKNHRPLYEWVVDNCAPCLPSHPKQREFARLNVTHTVMSKRYLRELVETGKVDGWDDPRMPTLCGLRRRGYTPSSILEFVTRAGVSTTDSLVDIKLLEYCIRDELNNTALRRMAVTEPIKMVITNYPEDKEETFEIANNPKDESTGTRQVPFTRELWIEKSDFAIVPPPKFKRLKPDGEVRLMGAYIVKCNEVIQDADGNVVEVHCTADLEAGNGNPLDGRKVRGNIHWVSAKYAVDADLNLFDNLFTLENTASVPEGTNYLDYLNPESKQQLTGCKLEPSIAEVPAGTRMQFVRMGYYVQDSKPSENGRLCFNRIVSLKDSFKPDKK